MAVIIGDAQIKSNTENVPKNIASSKEAYVHTEKKD